MTRKSFLLLLVAFMAMVGVQAQHLLFEDIPIDGPFAQFDKKLLAKGFTHHEDNNLDDGVMDYNGEVLGKSALVQVHFAPKSQTVYAVSAIRTFDNKTDCLRQITLWKGVLSLQVIPILQGKLGKKFEVEKENGSSSFFCPDDGSYISLHDEYIEDSHLAIIHYLDGQNADKVEREGEISF